MIINFIIDERLLKRIEDFRFRNRFPTRAAAIKWLLDWALKQKSSVRDSTRELEVEPPAEDHQIVEPSQAPAPESVKPERQPSPSQASMIQALRDQGHEVGDVVRRPDGQERILVRSQDRSAWVNVVQELADLAAARITLAEVGARRAAGK